jgi:tetratricopeptide (TPR) repeat protein
MRKHTRTSLVDEEWLTFVDKWWNQLSAREQRTIGHTILGQLWYLYADFRAAKVHYRASLVVAGPRQDPAWRCYTLLRIAGCYRALSEYKRVLDRGQEAHHLATMLRDDLLEAQAAGTIGNAWFNMGENSKAVGWYERNVEILRKLGNRDTELGSSLANLGNAYGAGGNLEKAIECFREGIELARDHGDKLGEGSRLGGMGQVFGMMKHWEEAEAAHLKALNIARAMADMPGIARQLGQLALLENERGRFDEAIEMATQAAAMFSAIGDRQGEARALGNLGTYYLKVDKVVEATHCFRHSEEIAIAIGDQSVLEVARRNLTLVEAAKRIIGRHPSNKA